MRVCLLLLVAYFMVFAFSSCNKDYIEDVNTVSKDGAISFESRLSSKNIFSSNIKSSKNKAKTVFCDWGHLSVDISTLGVDIKGKCKAAKVSNVSELLNAGIMAYHTIGDFTDDPETGSLPNFRYNQLMTKEVSQWTYSPVMYWPANEDERVSFFSYSPYISETNGISISANMVKGTPYLGYKMREIVSDQPDLLISVPVLNNTRESGVVNFQYKHAFSCIGFSLQGNGEQIKSIGVKGIQDTGRISLDGSTIVWSNLDGDVGNQYNAGINLDAGQNYVTATATRIEESSLMQIDGYLMVIPQALSVNAKLVVVFSDDSYKEVCLSCVTSEWLAGEKYTYNIVMTPDSSPEISSNCFIVNPNNGTVRIPTNNVNVFWGQGGDGAIATYMENNGESGIPSQAAKNHVVTEKLINDGSYTVEVVWSDVALTPTFSNQTVDSFDVSGLTQEGNVVVGIKKTGVTGYLWSWHIWITDFDPDDTANQITLPNGQITMDRNLGALSNVPGQVATLGLFYQWGRKDPFLGSSSIKSNAPLSPVIGTIGVGSVSTGTLLLCISNPNILYPANSNNQDAVNSGHLSGEYGYNRWGGAVSNTTLILSKNSKSIYDPCPDGWRISWGANWTGITESTTFEWNQQNRGSTYSNNGDEAFFPAPGCLNFASGSLGTVGTCGHYWSGSPCDYEKGCCLYITVGSYTPAISRERASGFCVRPVKE